MTSNHWEWPETRSSNVTYDVEVDVVPLQKRELVVVVLKLFSLFTFNLRHTSCLIHVGYIMGTRRQDAITRSHKHTQATSPHPATAMAPDCSTIGSSGYRRPYHTPPSRLIVSLHQSISHTNPSSTSACTPKEQQSDSPTVTVAAHTQTQP